jgi:hypothetical protein
MGRLSKGRRMKCQLERLKTVSGDERSDYDSESTEEDDDIDLRTLVLQKEVKNLQDKVARLERAHQKDKRTINMLIAKEAEAEVAELGGDGNADDDSILHSMRDVCLW